MKTTGKLRDDGSKDYSIHHNGTTYKAVRSGSLFLCNGMKGTLKEIKESIAAGSLDDQKPEPQAVQQMSGTWDSVHPCALLVLLTDPVSLTSGITDEVYKEVSRTLDNYGWKFDGVPDVERAEREMDRFKQTETGEF